jgi:hypothetical protein
LENSTVGASGVSSCGSCGLQETCQAGSAGDGPFKGASLVAAAFGYFLFPLVLALSGAVLLSESALTQFLGGAGGMLVGMIISTRVARLVCAGFEGGR